MRNACLALLAALALGSCQPRRLSRSGKVEGFHIGNSLTWDMQPGGVVEIAQDRGYTAEAGYHITCGKPLTYIYKNPKDTCVKPAEKFGTWGEALTGRALTFLTMQPHGGASTLKSEVDAIVNWIDLCSKVPENKNTTYYIFAAWPPRKDFVKTWTEDFPDEDSRPTVMCAKYFNHLMERVRRRTGRSVRMIPAGEVLFNLDKKLKSGLVSGLMSVDDLYRDSVHLKNDIGRFAVGLTAWATIYQESIRSIKKPRNHYGKADGFSDDYYKALRETITEVLARNPYTD